MTLVSFLTCCRRLNVARIELPDGSQLPRIGVMVSGLYIDAVMAAFEALQPDQPWLQVLLGTLGLASTSHHTMCR